VVLHLDHLHKIKKMKLNQVHVQNVNQVDHLNLIWKKYWFISKNKRINSTECLFYFKTLYRNYQRISIQESPGTVPPGRIPRSKEILLLGDLCDTCRPGDEIVCVLITSVSFYWINIFLQEVLGVYRNTYNISLNIQNNLPVFATIIEANYISTREDKISFETLTDEDIQEIQRLAKEPKIAQRVRFFGCCFFSLNLLIIFRFTQVLDHRFMVMKWLKKLLHLRCLVVNQKIPVGITNFLYSNIMRLMD
jgi:DNA replicative helicase MCM subunit Mcm2 (Cdc46/Mcm family)